MSIEPFRAFIDHAYWGRDRILGALDRADAAALGEAPLAGLPAPRDTIRHMIGFERLFAGALTGRAPERGPSREQVATVAGIREAWAETERAWRAILDGLADDDLDRALTLPWGDPPLEVRVRDVLHQFVQHQGQHRSELAAVLTASGVSPGDFDWWDYLGLRG